ncbi:MAG: excinuclease ABC subunit UvrC [Bacteriovoracaceae bacterium]|nr:excinuclease ABC subunit UvrC [Bacteriovoracaceae bacterium]
MTEMRGLLEKAKTLPSESGCYLMKDNNNRVIYVGKAKRLRSRVTSYFDSSVKSLKTQFLVSHILDFEFILTQSDAESYVLENNLIKKHNPKYNIRLKDDKSYPWIMVDHEEAFPKLEYVRRPKKGKGKELFGPFPMGSNISTVMRVLTKSFMLRDCSLSEFKSRKTPCLLYQMQQCSAPCVKLISESDYEKDLKLASGFFQSSIKANRALKELHLRMEKYSEDEQFERAAIIRDHIQILESFLETSYEQNVESLKDENDVDVWAAYQGSEEFDFSLYMIRGGMLIGQKNFHFLVSDLSEDLNEEMKVFLLQYYGDSEQVSPPLIILDSDEKEIEDFSLALKEVSQGTHAIKVLGLKKKYLPVIEMCRKHAQECQRVRIANQDSPFVGLKKLKELLNLKELPRHLECYDVAIWQGKSPAASQVVSHDGKLDKKSYRYYHLQELPEGNNDFAMMREVITRRLKHGELPDVLVIDGGVAQVNTVCAVLREMQIELPVVGIAKAKDLSGDFKKTEIVKSDERLVIPGRKDPYLLFKTPALMRIIVSLRDEAHRFSRKLHHKAESKRVMATWIDEVEGIGEKVKQTILKNLNVPKETLKEMNANDISKLLGITIKQAVSITRHLNRAIEEDD